MTDSDADWQSYFHTERLKIKVGTSLWGTSNMYLKNKNGLNKLKIIASSML